MASPEKQGQGALAEVESQDQFAQLMGQSLRISEEDTHATEDVRGAVALIVEDALKNAVSPDADVISRIEAMVAELDKTLSSQIDQILHHEDFRQMEGTWRGFFHMVSNTATDTMLKIRVLNISKKEIGKTLKKYPGSKWDQSPLFKKLYEEEYGTPNGQPYGTIVADYDFDHSAPDVAILEGMSKIAAAAHAPFIAATSPSVLGMESWRELNDPADLSKRFAGPQYARWRALRESDDSRYVSLTMPRFLSRLPYSSTENPIEEFVYEENTGKGDHDKFSWSNSAYAMGTNIMRSFKTYGWCASIRGLESGGQVMGLPCHTFPTDDGDVDMKCPTEVSITKRREKELADLGFMPLSHWKNESYAVFVGAQTLNKPKTFDDPDATANANLSARLPYIFSCCRFAHFLNHMIYNWIGRNMERSDIADELERWISNYVVNDPTAGDEIKAQYPLAAAEVKVDEDPSNPGYYSAQFFLRPHFQLEGMTGSLRLVSKVPSAKNAG